MRNNKDQYKRIISFFSSVCIVSILTGIFGIIWYEFYSHEIISPFYRKGNWLVIVIYVVLIMLFFKAYGGFKIGYLKRVDMFYSQAISMICVDLLCYLQISVIGRRWMSFSPIILMLVIDVTLLICWTLLMNKLYQRIYPPRRLIIIYGSKSAETLVNKMSERSDKYIICESISEEEAAENIKHHIMKYEGVIICDVSAKLRNDILKYCFEHSVRAYAAPKISDIILRGAEDIRLFDTPLLLCRNYGLTFEQRLLKRIFDIVLSSLMLIVALPFMIIIALCIKLSDGGPIIYKQKRLTLNGKEFYVYKFRSMIPNAEKNGPQLAMEDDNRITKVGYILRKMRLDELPQIINILKGDMSIVGPRPERPELTEEYEKTMPEFRYRLKVKAGLTGYAQVTGVYDTSPYDKLKMDLMYIEHYSTIWDIRIILMTLKTMILPGKTNSEQNRIK